MALIAPYQASLLNLINDDAQPADAAWAAAWGLALSGPGAADAVPRMLTLGARASKFRGGRFVALRSTRALQTLCVADPAAARHLLAALEDKDPAIVSYACWTLGRSALCSEPVAQRLLAMLHEGDDVRAAAAASALCRAFWRPATTIPAILEEGMGGRVARAPILDPLWNFQDELIPYLQTLGELLNDPDAAVRISALGALGSCERDGSFRLAQSAVAPLIAALRSDPDPAVAQAAATTANGLSIP